MVHFGFSPTYLALHIAVNKWENAQALGVSIQEWRHSVLSVYDLRNVGAKLKMMLIPFPSMQLEYYMQARAALSYRKITLIQTQITP